MAKINTSISIDEDILEKAQVVAQNERRNFSNLVEVALLQFIERHMRQAQLPGLDKPQQEKVAA